MYIHLHFRENTCSCLAVHTSRWRHNERVGASNQLRLDRLLNRLFRRRSKKTHKLRVTGLCEGNSPVTGDFPAQMASNAEIVSIWWRHHDYLECSKHFYTTTSSNLNIPRASLLSSIHLFCIMISWHANASPDGSSHIEAETKWPPFPRRHFQTYFLEWKYSNFDKISLKSVPKVPIDNIPALVHIMARCRSGDKPLSESVMVCLLTHIYIYIYIYIYASLGLNELMNPLTKDQ